MVRAIFLFFMLSFSFAPAYADENGVDFEFIAGRYLPAADTAYAGLSISMDEGWHVYWKSPGEGGLPPEFKITSARNLSALDVEWPLPSEYEANGAISFGYGGNVSIPMRLKPTVPGQPVFVDIDLSMYGCSNICVPFRQKLSVVVAAEENAGISDETDRWLSRVPMHVGSVKLSGSLSNDGSALSIDVSDVSLETSSQPVIDLGPKFTAKFVEIDPDRVAHYEVRKVSDQSLSVADSALLMAQLKDGQVKSYSLELTSSAYTGVSPMILLISLTAGLILNVMPCVLPVLAIKLSGLTKEHSERRRGFLWTGIGIVTSFLLLASTVLLLKAAGQAIGWGIQFQSPLFLGVMSVITMLFAVSMLDGFMLRLPYQFTDKLLAFGRGSGRTASFFQGLVATLLATPCSAPLVGTAVGFAFSAGMFDMFAVFFAMGVGMALPYFLIYFLPSSKGLFPKSGSWMGKMKMLLALGLVATSGTLLAYLSISFLWGAISAAVAMAVLILAVIASKRLGSVMIVVLTGFGVLSYPFSRHGSIIDWQDFSPAEISQLVDSGKIVMVDVTAAWCITCKVNETVTFSNPDVVARLDDADIVAMRADWTVENPQISDYLKTFGRYGIPFTVIYTKENPKGQVLPEILTPGTLLGAL